MQIIRILTTEMPQSPMLREIFERVAENSQDMEIVDAALKKSELMDKIKEIEADVVIVDLKEHELPKIYADLTAAISSAVIVGIVDDGRRILVNARQVGVNELMDTIRALTRNRYKHKNTYKEQRDHSSKLKKINNQSNR
jgi:DNA-binding NarL/FixJ family response regulator